MRVFAQGAKAAQPPVAGPCGACRGLGRGGRAAAGERDGAAAASGAFRFGAISVYPRGARTGARTGGGTGGDSAGRPAAARGPRRDGADDAPYRGADDAAGAAARGPGGGKGMGCVLGSLKVLASGALKGGYSVNDYLSGGLSWGRVGAPTSAGSDNRGYKVQQYASYSGDKSLGVAQTMTHGGSNQAFLDGTAAYLGKAAGSVTNGTTYNEPVLDAGDPYKPTGWNLQYGPKSGAKDPGLVSFADVPRAGAGEKGYIDFKTTFHSRGGPCQQHSVSRTWRWTIDFTGTKNVNTVT